jgi:hypothetical protein
VAHISHLIEDRDVTQNDVVDIASAAWWGTLTNVTEKLDGVNIVFSSTSKYETRFSRSESDIKKGGMISAVLEAKFAGRDLVRDTFARGSNAICVAARAFTPLELLEAFESLRLWYSAEIINTRNPNVVAYDGDSIVLHERPVLRCFGESVLAVVSGQPGADAVRTVLKRVPDMNDSVSALKWRVLGPQNVILQRRSADGPLDELVRATRSWFGGEKTLQSVLTERARDDLKSYGMSEQLLDASVLRLSEAKGCPTLTALKARVPSQVASTLRASDEWVARQLRPLELAISDFAVELLNDVTPSLVADPIAETKRIRVKLEESLVLVKNSRNQHAIDYVKPHMEKLRDVSRFTTPVEGIVFPWKGKLYKLTGAFAPTNAIVGLCRYGRGRLMPPIFG